MLVSTVTPNGGAAKAGIKPGDVIVSIDGQPIKDGDDLVADISARKVGSTVKLGYPARRQAADAPTSPSATAPRPSPTRRQRRATTTPVPQSPTPARASSASPSQPSLRPSPAKLGIKGGVIVTSVRPGSFADEINLTKGAVITEINRNPVTDESQLPRHRLLTQIRR